MPTPRVDAELLVSHVLGWPRTKVRTAGTVVLSEEAAKELEALARRRTGREPLQLLVGSVGFRYLEVLVRPGVFIPRPETEVLAGLAIDRTPPAGIVVEPCTGTGVIACAVATEARPALVVATDTSAEAVELARVNAARARADVEVLAGDLLEPVADEFRGRVDVLVSNPPYLAAHELASLDPEVAGWDPHHALVSGPTGDEVAERLVNAAPQWLRPGGWLLLEVDPSRAETITTRMRERGLTEVSVVDDLTGAPRFPAARAGL